MPVNRALVGCDLEVRGLGHGEGDVSLKLVKLLIELLAQRGRLEARQILNKSLTLRSVHGGGVLSLQGFLHRSARGVGFKRSTVNTRRRGQFLSRGLTEGSRI